jgi:hypothetical protein
MMKYLFFLLFAFATNAQLLHHQSMSSQGKSLITKKGLGLSQTIGQQSVAGSAFGLDYVIQQGFQQSLLKSGKPILASPDVITRVFPNPFITTLSFEFNVEIKEEVQVNLYDALGRLVSSSKAIPLQNRITIMSLGSLSEGNYFASLSTKNFTYGAKIIKVNL